MTVQSDIQNTILFLDFWRSVDSWCRRLVSTSTSCGGLTECQVGWISIQVDVQGSMDESKSDPNSLTRKTRIFSFSLTIDSPKKLFGESTHRKGKHFSSLQNSSSWLKSSWFIFMNILDYSLFFCWELSDGVVRPASKTRTRISWTAASNASVSDVGLEFQLGNEHSMPSNTEF